MPDCVVLDLQMPLMTGVELQYHLLQLDDPPPVIIITAHDEPKARDRCLALGAIRYLRKPIEGDSADRIDSLKPSALGCRADHANRRKSFSWLRLLQPLIRISLVIRD